MTEGSNRFDASDPMMALNNRFFRRYRDNHRRPLEPSSLDSVRHPDLDRAAVSELSGGDLSDSGRAARSRHRAIVVFDTLQPAGSRVRVIGICAPQPMSGLARLLEPMRRAQSLRGLPSACRDV